MVMKQKIEITARDKTKAAASSVKRSLGGVSSAASSMGAQLGLAFGVGGMAFAIKQSLDAADKVQKLSISLGASTEALSQLKHAANLSGTSFEALTTGMKKLQKSSQDAVAGLSTNVRGFEALGISVERFAALAPEDQLAEFADAIAKIEEPSKRTQVAMDLMGRSGVDLIPMLEKGSKGLNDMRMEADRLGLTLSRDQVDAAAAANDAITRMTAANQALTQQMAIEFAPTIEAVAEFLGKELPAAADFTSAAFGDIRKAMGLAVAGIVTGLIELYDVLEELPGNFGIPYKTAKEEMLLFREAVFETIDQISEKQQEAAKVGLPTGEDGESKSIAAQMFGSEEEIQDDMDLALDMIEKQFDSLDVLYIQRLAGLNKIQMKAASEREQFMGKSATGQTKQVLGEMVKMTQGAARQNRAMFEANKAAATANAVIGAWQGAARTMGEYPYPFNIVLAGLSLASGFAQVSAIQSTSFGGGGGGGSVSGGGGVPSLAASPGTPTTETAIPTEDTRPEATIVVSGGLHSDEDVRNLIETMEEVKKDMGGNVTFTTS